MPIRSDLVVVGAGLGGATAAAVLNRAGFDITVVDRNAVYPHDFRAEQLVGSQIDILRSLGLLDGIVGQTLAVPRATAACHGKVIDARSQVHYGLRYEDMVNATRALATGTRFVTGRVTGIETGNEVQRVTLSDGTTLEARLVVLATGLICDDLLRALGIGRSVISANHSLTFGFDVETSSRGILTYYGEQTGDGIDYLTVFPFGATMRANLFCYRGPSDEWARSFKSRPKQAILEVMPRLEQVLGPFEVVGKVQARFNPIGRAENVRQAGIVLIGDAYQSSCPAVGSGVGRILSDVATLRRLAPAWFATPAMGADKIGQFYDDPLKCRFDQRAIRQAWSRRGLCLNTGWDWQARRSLRLQARRIRSWVHDLARLPRPSEAVSPSPAGPIGSFEGMSANL